MEEKRSVYEKIDDINHKISSKNKNKLKQLFHLKDYSAIIYHGSRGGLDGDIKPVSRNRCDFGRGFYTGTNPQQVKGLVVDDSDPVFYELSFDFSHIQDDKILILEDYDWLYTVLANRRRAELFNKTKMASYYRNLVSDRDIVIGPIADDRMNEAIRAFEDGALSDVGLIECLRKVNYGYQVVAKTEESCRHFSIITSHEIYGAEADMIRNYAVAKRAEGRNVVRQAIRKYRNVGYYIDELSNEFNQYKRYISINKNRKGLE